MLQSFEKFKEAEPWVPAFAGKAGAEVANLSSRSGYLPSLGEKSVPFRTLAVGFAARLGKIPARDGKLADSLTAVPAKAGIHFSAARNFQAEPMPYQLSDSPYGGEMDPGFRQGRRENVQ